MAASDIEKDYVHIAVKEASKIYNYAVFCICQVVSWERAYKNGEENLVVIL